jgi:hypothetical protein
LLDQDCGTECIGEENLVPRRLCGTEWRNAVYSQPPPALDARSLGSDVSTLCARAHWK